MHKLAVVLTMVCGIAHAESPKRTAQSRADVLVGKPKITGALDEKRVVLAMRRVQAQLVRCYKQGLAVDANLEVSATAMFAIGANGKVERGTVSLLGMPQPAVEKCVVGTLAKLYFARPKGKVEVELPLTFARIATVGAFASITGTGDFSSGFDDSGIYGTLTGNEIGESYGVGGLGTRGTGPGGGGTGWGTIGTGKYGTIGHGSGTGSGYGVAGRMTSLPGVSIGQPAVTGDLDKAIIRRYMKRNLMKIRYCYEKELVTKKNLSGTIRAQFTIGREGDVTAAAATEGTLKDAEVQKCIAGVIKAIQFPKPRGNGEVIVVYPLTFQAAATKK